MTLVTKMKPSAAGPGLAVEFVPDGDGGTEQQPWGHAR